jgi:GR25 family glycosyltransferase involved in LPS biosynthesis
MTAVDTYTRAFVIHLPKVKSSCTSAQSVLKQLHEFGFRAELFAGIDGETAEFLWHKENRRLAEFSIKPERIPVNEYRLRFPEESVPSNAVEIAIRKKFIDDVRYLKAQTPGVRGCFYSHYRLWQRCVELNEPVFIFEDDVMFERGWVPVDWQDVLMVCLGKKAYKHEFYSPLLYSPQGIPRAIDIPNLSLPGAVGYAIKPHAAQKLVECYVQDMLPADTAINQYVVRLQTHSYIMGRAAIAGDGKQSLTDTDDQ